MFEKQTFESRPNRGHEARPKHACVVECGGRDTAFGRVFNSLPPSNQHPYRQHQAIASPPVSRPGEATAGRVWPRAAGASRRMLLHAAPLASPEGCWKLAGHNLPGTRTSLLSRPGGALELSRGKLWFGLARRNRAKAAPQGPFKIKIFSQNARKLIQPNIGKYSHFDTPPVPPLFIRHFHRPIATKSFIFNRSDHHRAARSGVFGQPRKHSGQERRKSIYERFSKVQITK